ncbi:AAA family ATPase [Sphingobium sp. BHU LFT2]|uniref:ATPase domain-containing protein n=1 Tax=Sphingobium sp. BHU LFT2 TaxID=2807634 RepID=UPI001BE8DBB4|nr:AAA family ATPase [Sphingobium sp. BHU LFT2]
MHEISRLASEVPGLDQVLAGGFVHGASYIIQGQPGAGKTILSNQIAFNHIARGGRVLYVTLLSESHDRLFQALSGLEFFDKDRLGDEIAYVSVFQPLRSEGLEAVVKLLRRETKRQKATLLVFDGLLNARDRADSDFDVKTFVAEVQGQAAFVGCTVLFLTSASADDTSPEHTMVDGVIDLVDTLAGVRTVRQLRVRKSRGSRAISGLHSFEITDKGIEVYPRIEALPAEPASSGAETSGRLTSGSARLDGLIGGGLPTGSVTLVSGPTGSGKTTLGLQFLAQSSEKEPGLHFGFFENESRLRAKAKTLGIELPGYDAAHFVVQHSPLTENILDKLAHRLLNLAETHNVRRLFIDGLGGFERAAVHPPRMIPFFAMLTNRLRELGVTTLATWEIREIVSREVVAPSNDVSAVLDNLILLRQFEEDHELKRSISVQKMRDSGFNPAAHCVIIADGGLKIGDPLSTVAPLSASSLPPAD